MGAARCASCDVAGPVARSLGSHPGTGEPMCEACWAAALVHGGSEPWDADEAADVVQQALRMGWWDLARYIIARAEEAAADAGIDDLARAASSHVDPADVPPPASWPPDRYSIGGRAVVRTVVGRGLAVWSVRCASCDMHYSQHPKRARAMAEAARTSSHRCVCASN